MASWDTGHRGWRVDGGNGTKLPAHTWFREVHCRNPKPLQIFQKKKKKKGYQSSNSVLLKPLEGLEKWKSIIEFKVTSSVADITSVHYWSPFDSWVYGSLYFWIPLQLGGAMWLALASNMWKVTCRFWDETAKKAFEKFLVTVVTEETLG